MFTVLTQPFTLHDDVWVSVYKVENVKYEHLWFISK